MLNPGDVVFWQLPHAARLNKHFFPEPSAGPYEVKVQPTTTSAIPVHPTSRKLVNDGHPVPLDQLIAAPVRAQIAFDQEDNEVRSLSRMLSSDAAPDGDTAAETERVSPTGRKRKGGRVVQRAVGRYV